jgi:outer membrane protein OmpA-like peptidoglycan-associated protein
MTQGFYVGLGVGYDRADNIEFAQQGSPNFQEPTSNSALPEITFGYRFPNRIRLEEEVSWTQHDIGNGVGHERLLSVLYNGAYDFKLSSKWDFTIGAGAGYGVADVRALGLAAHGGNDSHKGWMWQAFSGFDYWIRRDMSLNLDYRYRDLSEAHEYFGYPPATQEHIKDLNERVLMLSIRWYPFSAPPPPPEPVAYVAPPPPPAPMMAPPTKTFIVFFDFNKANLTAEAQAVVAEAVKTAKANGFVKVLVTGHTDTVGSDSYNQGLSVRRAESVKDEMVREGLDGSTISIEGKSFHDPLVPTGPGVREPQNRRAVIDLGG